MASVITVGEILDLPELAGARVVAGGSGVARPVDKLDVVADRETLRHARRGLLLLASGPTLADDPAALVTLVPELAGAEVAALVLKPPSWVADIPAEALKIAESLGFPLIELPETTRLNDVDDAVLRLLFDHQSGRLRRAADIHERFTAVVLSGGRTRDVVLTLHQLLGRPVAVVDRDGDLIVAEPAEAWPEIAADDHRVEHPIQAGDEAFGTILVRTGPNGLDDEGTIAVERAAVAIALRQVQARAIAEEQEGFAAISLEELISGQVTDADTLAERAATLGWDLEPARAVLLVAIGEPPWGAAQRELRVLAAAARQALGTSAIVWVRSRTVAALVVPPSEDPADRRKLAEVLQREARARLGRVPVSVGVGRPVDDPLHLPHSFREAQLALDAGTWEQGPGTVRIYEDLGVERLFAACPPAELDDFVSATLGPLLDYDRYHGGELVATLAAWLETRSVAETARRVYAHYNTVRKRLERIEELIGPVVDDSRRALDLAVALRLHERSRPRRG